MRINKNQVQMNSMKNSQTGILISKGGKWQRQTLKPYLFIKLNLSMKLFAKLLNCFADNVFKKKKNEKLYTKIYRKVLLGK